MKQRQLQKVGQKEPGKDNERNGNVKKGRGNAIVGTLTSLGRERSLQRNNLAISIANAENIALIKLQSKNEKKYLSHFGK